jgi:FAD/FMN-containing dehydrogenase
LANWQQAYYGANHARLVQVKAAYDPNEVFKPLQGIAL